MTVTAQQVRLLMKNYEKTGSVEKASASADVCRQTGAKQLHGPSPNGDASSVDRHWRTRRDPLEEVWGIAEEMLSGVSAGQSSALLL